MVEGKHGGVFEMETLYVFRNNKHVVVYRSVDELLGMVRASLDSPGPGVTISIEVIRTAVEQPASQS